MNPVPPRCEGCGHEDAELRDWLVKSGHWGAIPQPLPGNLRPPFLCGDCRGLLGELLRATRAELDEKEVVA